MNTRQHCIFNDADIDAYTYNTESYTPEQIAEQTDNKKSFRNIS